MTRTHLNPWCRNAVVIIVPGQAVFDYLLQNGHETGDDVLEGRHVISDQVVKHG